MSKAPAVIHSNWNQFIDGLNSSPKQYYASVEQAIQKRQVPDVKIRLIKWREGGVFSGKRLYLRVQRDQLVFDICGAPFGTGFFFSWWLGEMPSGWLALVSHIPIIGTLFVWIMQRFIKPDTYYKIDTTNMFQKIVHAAVLEVVDDYTNASGLRLLSEHERKPVARNFFDTAA